MAGRAHKRLQQQQLGAALAEPALEEAEASSEEEEEPQQAPFNPFSLLTDDEVRGRELRSCQRLAGRKCGRSRVC